MSQEALQHQNDMVCFRLGTAVTGGVLNTAMMMYPGFLFNAALNWRQVLVAKRTKEMVKQAMEAKQRALGDRTTSRGHIKGTYRYFLIGAGMKAAIFVVFLGHIHAEGFVINHLNPADILPVDVAASHPVQHTTEALHNNIHEAFAVPHAFYANPVVHVLQEIGNVPQEAILAGQHLLHFSEIQNSTQFMEQLAVGPAIETNMPAILAEKAMENAAEDWSRWHNRSDGPSCTERLHL